MANYLTVERFKLLTLLPASWVDAVEAVSPGYTAARIGVASDHVDSRLRKRYGAPFMDPVPGIIEKWVTQIVTMDIDLKRGVSPTDEQFKIIAGQHDAALAEIKEAADSDVGLFDLPMRDDLLGSGISLGGPRAYSEQSPYVYTDAQAEIGHQQDRARRGSGTT